MIRPVDFTPSQNFGDNPTKWLPADNWLIQTFGNYQPDGHTGTDYPCTAGTPVRAVTGGVVLHVGWYAGTYADNPYWISPSFAGFVYVVDHGTFIGIYAHCMEGGQKVSVGQRVSEGQVLGLSGNTGASTGDHLHFEALPDGFVVNSYMYGRVNPATYLASAGTVQNQNSSITPIEKPKEWDEMASREDIKQVLLEVAKEGPAGRNLGYYNWIETPLSGWNGKVSAGGRLVGVDQAVNDIRAQLAVSNAQIPALISAVAALSKGEPFDEAKLLEGVRKAASEGVGEWIKSVTSETKETVVSKEASA